MRAIAPPAALAVLAVLAACSGSSTPAGSCSFPPAVSGEATTYAGTSAGACTFPAGATLYAAVSPTVYDGAFACGTCLEVTGAAGTVTLEVTDLCPDCAQLQLDLSPDAWTAVTGKIPGREPIAWRRVPCAGTGPVRFVAFDGTNPWWVGVVVEDHRYPVAALELLPAGATAWIPLARQEWNAWVGMTTAAGGFAAPLQFRATDAFGGTTTTTVAMETIASGAEATAPQFPDACGG